MVLAIPAQPDDERDSVADAWARSGGTVERIARFWEPPPLDAARVRVYGGETFCLVLAQLLGLRLLAPDDDLLLALDAALLGREVIGVAVADAQTISFPRFVKPVTPKQFHARVYEHAHDLVAATSGIDPAAMLLVAEPVEFVAEARTFVLDGRVLASAVYEGATDEAAAADFAEIVAATVELPRAVVIDVGLLRDRWVIVEANAAWGAGLNGCDAAAVLPCIAAASFRE